MKLRSVSLLLIVGTMGAPGPVLAQQADTVPGVGQWRAYSLEASQRFGIPVTWIEQVMGAESAGRTIWNGRPITSKAGAMGLMQLMPETYDDMRKRYALGTDPYDPHDNILAGAAYLRLQFEQYGYPGLFAAYNAGPGRYEASLKGQVLPSETRTYLRKVTGKLDKPAPNQGLFIALTGTQANPSDAPKAMLFVPLTGDKSVEN